MRDIYLYGTIGVGGWWDDDMVSARSVISQLDQAGSEDVTLHINSGGGDVFEAVAIVAAIKQHKGRVTASIEGLAASAASVISCAAEECTIYEGSFVMVHDPWAFATGDAESLRDVADRLDKTRDSIASQYASKTGRDVEEMKGLMADETWMDASEAVEMGFADNVDGTSAIAACAPRHVLSSYRHAPEGVKVGRCERHANMPGDDTGSKDAAAGSTAACAGSARRRPSVVGGNVY